MRRGIVLATVVLILLAAGVVFAETCLSPYIKGLRGPEKVMYLWTLPADGHGSDYLTVIDVHLPSPTYGKILEKVEVGSVGNEVPDVIVPPSITARGAPTSSAQRFRER